MTLRIPIYPGLLPLGLGLGLTFVPITLAGTSEVSVKMPGLDPSAQHRPGGRGSIGLGDPLRPSRKAGRQVPPTARSLPARSCSPGFRLPRRLRRRCRTPRAAWTVAALQLRTRHVRESKRVDVPPDLARSSGRMRAVRTRGDHQRQAQPKTRHIRPMTHYSASSVMRTRGAARPLVGSRAASRAMSRLADSDADC